MGRSYNHWTEAEVAALKEGVVRFGVGNWQKIVNDYPVLRQRTGVQLKDKYRNMIKFRHLAANDLAAEVPPPRRRSSGRQRSPAVSAGGPTTSNGAAAVSQQQQPPAPPPQQAPQQLAAPQQQQQPPAPLHAMRSTGQSPLSLSPAQQQAQVAAQQAAAQSRLQAAQAGLQHARAAYIQQLAAAIVRQGAAAAAGEEAAEAAQRLGPPSPQVSGLQQVAQWWQQQAAMAQQLLLATRQMYLQAAEDAQQAQAAANAAAAAVLKSAECLADSQAHRGGLPTVSGSGANEPGLPVRHSNRRKAALNRKRFLEEEAGEEDHPALPSRPSSAMSGPAASGVGAAGIDFLPVIEEAIDGGGGGTSSGKRRKTGAQKRLYEDTRFGIYDDRRYRSAAPATSQPRRQSSQNSAGAGAAGQATAASAPPHGAVNGAAGRARRAPAGRGRGRRRRRPRHLDADFDGEDDSLDEEDARMAEAELAEADEDEDEWQRQLRAQDQRDVDCPCGVGYDDGQDMVECEGCGVWAHTACLARYGRLRPGLGRHFCSNCQAGFGSPLAANTPTAAAAAAAGALSPRGAAVALAARRQAFRTADSFNNDELYDIAAFLDNMGPGHRGQGEAAVELKADPEPETAETPGGSRRVRWREPGAPPVPSWGRRGPRRGRSRRLAGATGPPAWPCAGVTEPLPPRKRQRLPPLPPMGLHGSLAAWQQGRGLPLAGMSPGLMARLSGLQQPPLHPAGLVPALPPFLPFPPPLPGELPPASMAAAAAAAAAAALGRPWTMATPDGVDSAAEPAPESGKAAAVAEIMQIMQGSSSGLGLPPPAPRPMLPAAAASALLSSRQPTPSPPIDLMHRSDLHDADLQDDLHAQDWLAAAASLARADSQPQYQPFASNGLDAAVTGTASQQLPSLGGSPARLPPLGQLTGMLPLPPLGLQEQQHWLAGVMGSMQPPRPAGSAGRGEALGGGGGSLSLRSLGGAPGSAPGSGGAAADSHAPSVHRRLQQLAEGAGAAAAAAAAAGHRQLGSMSALDAAQTADGFGRYRQGSLHSLHQLGAPDLAVEGLQGLTPAASAQADALLEDDDADAEGPQLLISAVKQVEEAEQAAAAAAAAVDAAVQQGEAEEHQRRRQQPGQQHQGWGSRRAAAPAATK
ncbi:hypothetical protein ABPG77_005074 [Micractinium sp. CCAP 211/92]